MDKLLDNEPAEPWAQENDRCGNGYDVFNHFSWVAFWEDKHTGKCVLKCTKVTFWYIEHRI